MSVHILGYATRKGKMDENTVRQFLFVKSIRYYRVIFLYAHIHPYFSRTNYSGVHLTLSHFAFKLSFF